MKTFKNSWSIIKVVLIALIFGFISLILSRLFNPNSTSFFNPCTHADQCSGDFDCNVDADDVTKFLEDFGRSQFFNPCPACVAGDWCVYP
jgi:hypothetical protein